MDIFLYTLSYISWIVYNNFFYVFVTLGIFFIPLLIYIYQHWFSLTGMDANTSTVQVSIKRMLISLIMFLIIFMIAIIPQFEINKTNIKTANSSMSKGQKNIIKNVDKVISENAITTNMETTRVPYVWAAIDIATNYLNKKMISVLPKNVKDVRMQMESLSKLRLDNNETQLTYDEFYHNCYSAALGKYQRMRKANQVKEQVKSKIDWVGADFFVNTEGFYKKCEKTNSSCYKEVIYPEGINVLFQSKNGIRYEKSCYKWWSESNGIRDILINEFNIETESFDVESGESQISDAEKDILIRQAIRSSKTEPKSLGLINSGEEMDISWSKPIDSIIMIGKRLLVLLGAAILGLITEIITTAIVVFLPFTQALILFLMIILLPVAMVVGAIEIGVLFQFMVFYIAIKFLTVLWALFNWLDNYLLYVVYDTGDNSIVETAVSAISVFSTKGLLINIITGLMYVFGTYFYFKVLAMAGVKGADYMKQTYDKVGDTGDKLGNSTEQVTKNIKK